MVPSMCPVDTTFQSTSTRFSSINVAKLLPVFQVLNEQVVGNTLDTILS